MEIWQNLEKKRITDHDFPPPFVNWNWRKNHDKAIEEVNEQVRRVTEVGNFKRCCPMRRVCDAINSGL